VQIRKFVVTSEDVLAEQGREVGRIVRRAVCSAVIVNPLAGKPGADLAELEKMGAEISAQLAERALAALGVAAGDVTAYGKGAIVGTSGEIEHAAALIHPRFGAPVRKVVVFRPPRKLVGPAPTSRFRSRTKTTSGRSTRWTQSTCGFLMRRRPTKSW